MSTSSIYRTPAGEAEIMRLYESNWVRLGIQYESRRVNTRFGITHVPTTGPEDAPPLVIFHGGNMINPISFEWFVPLVSEYRIYAPDTVGHPGRSAQTRLSPRDNSYGEWAADVLDGLGLQQAPCIGPSYGAGILIRLAACAPQRISKAVLLVPSGFVSPPLGPMIFEVVIPMLLYRLAPSRERLALALRAFAPEADENVLEITGAVFKHVKIEPEMPRNAMREELAGFRAPTLVLAAERDIFFPAARVIERARDIIPNLTAAEIIKESPHMVSVSRQGYVVDRIRQFLKETR